MHVITRKRLNEFAKFYPDIAVVTNVRTQVSTSANKGLKPLVLR